MSSWHSLLIYITKTAAFAATKWNVILTKFLDSLTQGAVFISHKIMVICEVKSVMNNYAI